MIPTAHTLDVLRENDCWAVAAITCDSVTLSNPGTRSQAMNFSVQVLAASDQRVASRLDGEQYVADQGLLEAGLSYLAVLICDVVYDGSGAWKVIQVTPFTGSDAKAAVTDAHLKVSDALNET
jgi:hypothetical protein